MNIKALLALLGFCIYYGSCYAQIKKVEENKKNEFEISTLVLNTSNFAMAKSITPEFGYSRYMGEYVKIGVFYRRFSYNTGAKFDNYGLKAGFLPLPLFIKNEGFNKLWEAELSFNYVYETVKWDSTSFTRKTSRVLARLGVSRKVYRNLHAFCNIDVWNENKVCLGVRYKF